MLFYFFLKFVFCMKKGAKIIKNIEVITVQMQSYVIKSLVHI